MLFWVIDLDKLIGRLREVDRAVHVLLFILILLSNGAVGDAGILLSLQN